MNYYEAMDFINSKLVFGSKPGLSRIGRLLELMGNPQNSIKFIHLAGTNGKGSTSAMISSALIEAGYKTGLYISPYVVDFRERIQINGEYIKENELANLIEYIKPLCEEVEKQSESPTEFEVITALAFEHYKRQQCDYVVLETGLGGRFDATNIIPIPLAAVITSISFDHMQYLGDTLAKIAAEKCGIIKKGTNVISYPLQEKEALEVIKNRVKEEKARLTIPNLNEFKMKSYSLLGSTFIYKGLEIYIPLVGEYQCYNAITAIEALLSLNITKEAIINGLHNVVFPARFEVVSQNPLAIVDGAHNLDGIVKLSENIEKLLKGKKLITIMGMLKDKSYEKPIKMMATLSETFIAVTPNNPRALEGNETARVAGEHCGNVIIANTLKEAAKMAKSLANEENAILVCGSLYIAGELREQFIKYN
jgi:dihydrofolate synthase/folylpolyglutamate synthase